MLSGIKNKTRNYFLNKESETPRLKKGCNYNKAQDIAILYKDKDDELFRKIKQFVKYLHEEHGIRKVLAFAFIDASGKEIPERQMHKLEFDYYTIEDISWHLKAKANVKKFTHHEFDILINLAHQEEVGINYIINHSKAKMKIGKAGISFEDKYDLLVDMHDDKDIDEYIKQVNYFLSNFEIQ